jgi:zinc protease
VSRRSLFTFSIVLGLLAWAATLQAAPIQQFTLSNGLKVILLEEHKAPVVTFQIWYKVGSRNEVSGKTGVSHLTEHMMFKGTTHYGKGEFSKIVASNGGTENAFTDRDYTAYFENFSADRVGLSLKLEPDRMTNLLVDPKEFQLERAVVKEERRLRTEDDPQSFLIEQMYAEAFMVHPYHNPVIGWMTDLDHLTRDDVYNYYKRYYLPNNATIVVVGDFDTSVLLAKIKAAFEPIPPGDPPPAVMSVEPEQLGERQIAVKKEAELPFVFAGYRTPNYASQDTYALRVLSHLLSTGKSSRLYQSLVYEKQIALDVGGEYNGLTSDPDLFYFYGVPRPGKSNAELEKTLYQEIERIKNEPVSDRELQKAKNQIEAAFILGRDSNFFQAMQLGTMESIGAGVHYFETYLDNIRKVTKEDVRRVAKQYLVEDHRTVGTLIPLPPKRKGPS